VKTVFLYNVSIRLLHGVWRHLYKLSATSNINYGELRHCQGRRFHYRNLVIILNLILYITHTSGRVYICRAIIPK